MKNRPTNEHIKQQAQRANDYAEQNENSRRRGSGTFEDLELDQAQTPDRVDQSNWSWTESGSQQYQEALADDSMLPDLPEETPQPKYDESKQLGLVDADLVNDTTDMNEQNKSPVS
ncbi:hypothetical protein VKS41_005097 [Umbelopsis sp. WA50703]